VINFSHPSKDNGLGRGGVLITLIRDKQLRSLLSNSTEYGNLK